MAIKQAQSQQYRHQSDIIGIALLSLLLTLYLFHNLLQSLYFDYEQTNADIVGISEHLKSNNNTYPNSQTNIPLSNQIYGSQIGDKYSSGSHLLILFLKSSRFFKFFYFTGTICQTSEAKNVIEFRPYLLLFTEFPKNQIEFVSCILSS